MQRASPAEGTRIFSPQSWSGILGSVSLRREPSRLLLAGFLAASQPHAEPPSSPPGQASLGHGQPCPPERSVNLETGVWPPRWLMCYRSGGVRLPRSPSGRRAAGGFSVLCRESRCGRSQRGGPSPSKQKPESLYKHGGINASSWLSRQVLRVDGSPEPACL